MTPLKPYSLTPPPLPLSTSFSSHTSPSDTFPLSPPSHPCRLAAPLLATSSYFLLTSSTLLIFPHSSSSSLPPPSHKVPLEAVRRVARR